MVLGAVEKGATDGQNLYANDLVKALRTGVTARPRGLTTNSKGKRVRKRKSEGDALKNKSEEEKGKSANWGLLEPFRVLLQPAIDLCKPLFTLQSLVGLLLFLLIISYL